MDLDEWILEDGFRVEFSGRDEYGLTIYNECENLRVEEQDPNFPQQAALRSPLVIKCTALLPDDLSNFEVHLTVPENNMVSMIADGVPDDFDESMELDPWSQEAADHRDAANQKEPEMEMFSTEDEEFSMNVEMPLSDSVLKINFESNESRTRAELLADLRSTPSRKRRAGSESVFTWATMNRSNAQGIFGFTLFDEEGNVLYQRTPSRIEQGQSKTITVSQIIDSIKFETSSTDGTYTSVSVTIGGENEKYNCIDCESNSPSSRLHQLYMDGARGFTVQAIKGMANCKDSCTFQRGKYSPTSLTTSLITISQNFGKKIKN